MNITDLKIGDVFRHRGSEYVLLKLENNEDKSSMAYDRKYYVIHLNILKNMGDIINQEELLKRSTILSLVGHTNIETDIVYEEAPFIFTSTTQIKIQRMVADDKPHWIRRV